MIEDIKNFIKAETLKLFVEQLEHIKTYSKERKEQILHSNEKYSHFDSFIAIGKIETFEEIEELINQIQKEYKRLYK